MQDRAFRGRDRFTFYLISLACTALLPVILRRARYYPLVLLRQKKMREKQNTRAKSLHIRENDTAAAFSYRVRELQN